MEEMRSLIKVVEDALGDAKQKTPFAIFYAGLQKAHGVEGVSVMDGRAVFAGIPFDYIIASGLWVIMIKLANMMETSIETKELVSRVGGVLGRLLNVGLLIAFPDISAARVAFEKQVLETGTRAFSLGYAAGMQIRVDEWKALQAGKTEAFLQGVERERGAAALRTQDRSFMEAWQTLSSLFFAPILKAANQYRDALDAELSMFEKNNLLSPNISVIHEFSEGRETHPEKCSRAINYLSLEIFHSPLMREHPILSLEVDEITLLREFSSLLPQIQKLRKIQSVYRAFPVNIMQMDEFILRHDPIGGGSLNTNWLNTQILLAVLGSSHTREYLESNEALSAMERVKKMSFEQVCECFLIRMRSKGYSPNEQKNALVLDILKHSISDLQQRSAKLNEGLLRDVFISLRPEDIAFNTDLAWQIALGNAVLPGLEWEADTPSEQVKALIEKVVDAIAWQKISAEEFVKIIEAGMLPAEQVIAGGLPQMQKRERKTAVDWLLYSQEYAPCMSVIDALHDVKMLEYTFELFQQHAERLSDRVLKQIFLCCVEHYIVDNIMQTKDMMELFLQLLNAMTEAAAQEVFSSTSLRRVFYAFREEVLNTYFSDDPLREKFEKQMGPILLRRFDAMGKILSREKVYAAPLGTYAERLTPWDEKKWRAPEEEMFRWTYEADSQVEERWAKYALARDQYFASKQTTKRQVKPRKKKTP